MGTMRRNIGYVIFAIASLFSRQAGAQGMYGFDFGLGKGTISKSYITPELTGYYLAKLSRTFYLGGAISYERYSFNHALNLTNGVAGNTISIKQKSAYLFFTPRLDVGIGYRKYWHVFTSFGPGILFSGKQWSNKLESYIGAYGTATDTTAFFTGGDLPALVSRYTIGAGRRIPTMRYFNIMISAEYSYIPANFTPHGPGLKTNYFCITVGVMHKFPMVVIEE